MKYSADKAILNSDDFAQIAWDAIEPIWGDLPISSRFNKLSEFMSELTEGQAGLISLDWCQKEIRNGGIPQLFCNSTGNLIPWAIKGFEMVGASKYADIISKASSMLGSEYPKSGSARRKAYKKLPQTDRDEIEKLEDLFFELINSKEYDLEFYRGNFVKNNPGHFIIM
jgi:hypothetical protein